MHYSTLLEPTSDWNIDGAMWITIAECLLHLHTQGNKSTNVLIWASCLSETIIVSYVVHVKFSWHWFSFPSCHDVVNGELDHFLACVNCCSTGVRTDDNVR